MKIEIAKCVRHEWEEIQTTEKYMNEYRRHSSTFWEHKLGSHGWNTIIDCQLYEDAYIVFKRKKNNAKPKIVNKQGQAKNPGD